MKKGDVIVTKGKGFISRCISLLTGSEWTHTSLAITDSKLLHLTESNNSTIIEASFNGVQLTNLSTLLKGAEKFVILRPKPNIVDVDKLVEDTKKFMNFKYSYWQLFIDFFLILLSKIFKSDFRRVVSIDADGVVCVEIIGKALLEGQGLWVKRGVLPTQLFPSDYIENRELFDYNDINKDW